MNYSCLADLLCRIKIAYKRFLVSIKVIRNKLSINFLFLLYKIGLLRGFFILEKEDKILVLLKYKFNKPSIFDIKIISKPSKRVYWSLNVLSKFYRKHALSTIYIISTSQGLLTSNDAILFKNISGEILCQIKI